MRGIVCFCLAAVLGGAGAAPPAQIPLRGEERSEAGGGLAAQRKRPLYGRFLHVTGA